jgi:hypothetical protein
MKRSKTTDSSGDFSFQGQKNISIDFSIDVFVCQGLASGSSDVSFVRVTRQGGIQRMKKSFGIIALLFAALSAPATLRADITYTVDQTVDIGSITGTITTDGTTPNLTMSDIVSWDLTLNDGTTIVDLIPSNSFLGIVGSDLTASGTDLMFNFGGTDDGYFFISDPATPPEGAFCYETSTACSSFPAGIVIYDLGGDNLFPFAAESGNQDIATVTPEPSTGVLLLTGIVLMILLRKRIAHGFRLNTSTN